jgi:hypothetical protein
LGYQRNDAASNLRKRGNLTLTIGLLVDDIANPFFSALARYRGFRAPTRLPGPHWQLAEQPGA